MATFGSFQRLLPFFGVSLQYMGYHRRRCRNHTVYPAKQNLSACIPGRREEERMAAARKVQRRIGRVRHVLVTRIHVKLTSSAGDRGSRQSAWPP